MPQIELSQEEKMEAKSTDIFEIIKDDLKKKDIEFSSDEEKLKIKFQWSDSTLVYRTVISVLNKFQRITWTVYFSFTVDINTDSYAENLIAMNLLNQRLVFGTYSLDPEDGCTELGYSLLYRNSFINAELISQMTQIILSSASEYGEKLLFISRGKLDAEKIFEDDK